MPTLRVAFETRDFVAGAKAAQQATKDVADSTSKMDATLRKADEAVKRSTHTHAFLRGELMLLAHVYLGFRAAVGVTRELATMEDTMIRLKIITEDVTKAADAQERSFQALTGTIERLGTTTAFSMNEAAKGALTFAKAGFEAAEITQMLESAIVLAIGADLSLDDAAGILTNTIRQYGVEAHKAAEITNSLVVVANETDTDVREMAEAFKYVGPIAAAMGASIAETGAMIGVLGDRGLKASLAGTSLRRVFAELASPTVKAQRALDELGLSMDEINPAKAGIIPVWEKFGEAIRKLEDPTRTAALLNEIFGDRATIAALVLQEYSGRVKELTAQQEANTTSSKRLADELNQSLGVRLKQTGSAAKALAITLGDRLGITGGMKNVADAAKGAMLGIAGVRGATEGMSLTSKVLAGTILALVTGLSFLAATRATGAMIAAAGALRTLGVAGIFAQAATMPLTSLFTIIAGVGAALGLASYAMDKFGASTSNVVSETEKLNFSLEQIDKDIEKARRRGDDAAVAAGILERIRAMRELISLEEDRLRVQSTPVKGLGLDSSRNLTGGATVADFQQAKEQSALKALQDQLRSLEAEYQALIDKITGVGVATKATEAETKALVVAMLEMTGTLKDEIAMIGLSEQQKASAEVLEGALAIAMQRGNVSLSDRIRFVAEAMRLEKERFTTSAAQEAVEARQAARVDAIKGAWSSLNDTMKDWAKVHREGAKNLQDLLTLEQRRVELSKLSAQDREVEEAKQNALNIAMEKGVQISDGYLQSLEIAIRARQALESIARNATLQGAGDTPQKIRDAKRNAAEMITTLERERATMGMTTEEKERARMVDEYALELSKAKVANAVELTEQYRRQVEELQQMQRLEQLARDIGDSFGDMFTEFVTGAASAREAIESLARSILNLVVQEMAARPLANMVTAGLSSLFTGGFGGGGRTYNRGLDIGSAHGNAFLGGSVLPFAKGGVIDQPVTFPLGLAGEAGPEAILPLKRGADGNLGVANTGGSGGPNITINYNGVSDFDGVRKSERQVRTMLARAAKGI